jgi:hypothetical protein
MPHLRGHSFIFVRAMSKSYTVITIKHYTLRMCSITLKLVVFDVW